MSDDFIQNLMSDSEFQSQYLEEFVHSMKLSDVDISQEEIIQLLGDSNEISSDSLLQETSSMPPLPTVSAHWWGYRIRVSAEFLTWISVGGITTGAIALALAAVSAALGPAGPVIIGALAIYLLVQNAVLLIQANNCGGTVCIEALWAAPTVFKPKCCS